MKMKRDGTVGFVFALVVCCMSSSGTVGALEINEFRAAVMKVSDVALPPIPNPRAGRMAGLRNAHGVMFRVGDRVLHGDSVRAIEYLDNTGRVVLAENRTYKRTYVSIESISLIVPSSGAFKTGDKVIQGAFGMYGIRIIEYLDNTGRVVLAKNKTYSRSYVSTRTISLIAHSFGAFKQGDKVIQGAFGMYAIRTVEYLDNTGRIVLAKDRTYARAYVSAATVSLIVHSFGAFKTGDKVLHRDSVRTIEYLDNTGRVVLAKDRTYGRTFTDAEFISLIH